MSRRSQSPSNGNPASPVSAPPTYDLAGTSGLLGQTIRPAHAQPYTSTSPSSSSHVLSPTQPDESRRQTGKRTIVWAACLPCHKAKSKCDGARPVCNRCKARNIVCQYNVEPNTTRMASLKRKYDAMCQENDQLWQLYRFLGLRPDLESVILKQIRANVDLTSILNYIKSAYPRQPAYFYGNVHPNQAVLERIDLEALQDSSIKVRARPWTVVAGDGIVSELISYFFEKEQTYFHSHIDPRCFFEDMAAGEPEKAKHCSPLLVAVICAFSSMASPAVIRYDSVQGDSLRQSFFDEFRRLLDQECGRASITTLQALIIAFAYYSITGKDRAGTVYRCYASEMFKRLGLDNGVEHLIRDSTVPVDIQKRAALSRAVWGLFFCGNNIELLYLQPSLIPKPKIARYFCDPIVTKPPDKSLNALCDISEILYDCMLYNSTTSIGLGERDDVEIRMSYYHRLRRWERTSPLQGYDMIEDDQVLHFVRSYFHLAIISIFRQIQSIKYDLPDGLGTPADVCILHASCLIQEILAGMSNLQPEERGSCMVIYFSLCCIFTIVPLLDNPNTHDTFTQACYVLYKNASCYPLAGVLLRGVKALEKQLNVRLPESSLPYLQEFHLGHETIGDLPVSYIFPNASHPFDVLLNSGTEPQTSPFELGKIISKWSTLSVE